MRLRASHARPAKSARTYIPAIRGPIVSREAMERTHSCAKQCSFITVTKRGESLSPCWAFCVEIQPELRHGTTLTSLSDRTWMRRMEALGTALFLWLSAARMRGRWPRGGTWSASWLWVLKRQTAAVVTVSRASPCRKPQMPVRKAKEQKPFSLCFHLAHLLTLGLFFSSSSVRVSRSDTRNSRGLRSTHPG